MKNTALILTFLILATLGGILIVFENAYGDYILLVSIVLGLYMQIDKELGEHDCSDHEKVVSRSFFQDGNSRVVFLTGKEVKCTKCGKTRSV